MDNIESSTLCLEMDKILLEYGFFDKEYPSETFFERTLQLATKICNTQSAYISILGDEYQYILSQVGKKLSIIRKENSICQYTIKGSNVLVIPDTHEDQRTKHLDVAKEEDPIRFYAGYPLIDEQDNKLGAFCVTDKKSQNLTSTQEEALELLGEQVLTFLKLRKSFFKIIKKQGYKTTGKTDTEGLINQIEKNSNAISEERKFIEKANKEEKNKREELLHITNIFPGTIAKIDLNYRYVFNNDKYLEWTGMTRKELLKKNVPDLLGDEVFQRLKPLYDLVFTGETFQNEGLFELNARKKYLRVTYFPSKKGDIIDGAYVFSEDLTEIKSYQSQLENSNESLQSFAHIVSHDIKAPLRMIVNFGQLLKRDLENRNIEFEKDYLDFVINSGLQLTQLTSDLLAFAKIEHQKKQWQKIRINRVLDIVQLNLHELIDRSKAKIEINIEAEVVYGFKSDFVLLFQNFISNAIKYRRKDVPPIVKINCKPMGFKLEITIEDNGCGIPEDKFDEIFVPFKRLFNQEQTTEGSGIGLSTCQKIMENYDSSITIKSVVGKGSSFTFLLPAVLELTEQQ